MMYDAKPVRTAPLFVGAAAGALVALTRTQSHAPAVAGAQLKWILARQTASGAFDTAVGFGSCSIRPHRPDWRDILPVCGWADKVYALLAQLTPGPVPAGKCESVCRQVSMHGRTAEFTEDSSTITLRRNGDNWFVWRKGRVWPDVCRL